MDLQTLDTQPISSWPYPRVLLGIPLERAISHADLVFHNFMYIASQGPAFVETKYGRIDIVRNQMVQQLLSSTYTHLLMLDIDHVHPTDIIQRLARWVVLYPDIKVISGLNFRRKAPYDPVAGNIQASGERALMLEWPQGIIQVDEVGGASLLVHRSVFEQIPPPWFYNIYDEGVWKNNYPGEDIGFSRKCKEHGIPIYIDTTTSSPHCTEMLVTEDTFRHFVASHLDRFVSHE